MPNGHPDWKQDSNAKPNISAMNLSPSNRRPHNDSSETEEVPWKPCRLHDLLCHYTFYYTGPGGGGVDYSDDYLFNLHGKLLHIEFDGPYVDDNHPAPKVQELEPKLLATFRVF